MNVPQTKSICRRTYGKAGLLIIANLSVKKQIEKCA